MPPLERSEMQPHQLRVVSEKGELDEKIEKLKAFALTETYQSLDRNEQARLRRQLHAMNEYSVILDERIRAFE